MPWRSKTPRVIQVKGPSTLGVRHIADCYENILQPRETELDTIDVFNILIGFAPDYGASVIPK